MDFKEYIESGKLESYVLGTCTSEEAQEAECMARVFPEVKQELESIRTSIEQYAIAAKVEPPAALKAKILAAIDDDEKNSRNAEEARVISISKPGQSKGSALKFAIAASLALLIVSSFISYNLFQRNNSLADKLNKIQEQQKSEQQNFAALQNQLGNTQKQLLVMNNPNSLPVAMKGLPLSPHSLATVYWNKDSKEVYLTVNLLPLPPVGKQYQLWGIVNGAPVDLGVFEVPAPNSFVLQKMKSVDGAAAFAVTLEKTGGSPVPALDQMFVMGNI